MKSKGKKIIIGIALAVLVGFVGIKVTGYQYSGIDKKAILTTEDIKK
ncbi:hypothetical protein PN290_13470 [Romboutsia sp. 1001216sp1]|nr:MULTISPECIES: hypothetical protein [Romboutsia]MDB8794520.1 hypothetical protein [Romboutsia sp. 1001216sp1]MDB8797650.1 hypothetical protein [Romboutsia sp. 1001216sp1]MDB8800380.1 hypothetical protein [Romboutsia sp. 1001216sp1]